MTTHLTHDVSVRRAARDDHADLQSLAALDSARALHGEILIAQVGDEPQAAIEIGSGATVADPFRPTAHLVELLELRAARLDRRPSARPSLRAVVGHLHARRAAVKPVR